MQGRDTRHGRLTSSPRVGTRGGQRPRRFAVVLTEDVFRGNKQCRVDREAGCIYGVKILGLKSDNGREYTLEACHQAAPLYAGRMVNVDHPTDAHGNPKPTRMRSAYDRLAVIKDPYTESDGLYGNLLVLKGHPMAERLFEAAENSDKVNFFGLSHNAQGEGEQRNGVFVVHEITEVRSVDLVADPATTKSLCESKEGKHMATKISRQRLLEMGYEMEDEMPTGDGGGAEMEEEEEGPDEYDHLLNAFRAFKSKDPEKANKLLDMCKVEKPEQAEEAEDEEDGDDDDAEKETEEAEDMGDEEWLKNGEGDSTDKRADAGIDKSGKAHVIDARHGRRPKRGKAVVESRIEARRERRKAICKLTGINVPDDLLESYLQMDERGFYKALEHLKTLTPVAPAKPGKGGSKPRSQSLQQQGAGAGNQGKDVFESSGIPKDPAGQARWLMN